MNSYAGEKFGVQKFNDGQGGKIPIKPITKEEKRWGALITEWPSYFLKRQWNDIWSTLVWKIVKLSKRYYSKGFSFKWSPRIKTDK